jgi:hypothetical protein
MVCIHCGPKLNRAESVPIGGGENTTYSGGITAYQGTYAAPEFCTAIPAGKPLPGGRLSLLLAKNLAPMHAAPGRRGGLLAAHASKGEPEMSIAYEPAITRDGEAGGVPVLVPEPTAEFAERLQHLKASAVPNAIPIPIPVPHPLPIPLPLFNGARFLIWKQDPTVGTLGARIVYLPGLILNGPRNSRISTHLDGVTPVSRNSNGDFVFPINSP